MRARDWFGAAVLCVAAGVITWLSPKKKSATPPAPRPPPPPPAAPRVVPLTVDQLAQIVDLRLQTVTGVTDCPCPKCTARRLKAVN